MAHEEKRAWIMGGIAIVGYAVYLVVVLQRASDRPLTEVAYAAPLLWVVGAAIALAIALDIALGITSRCGTARVDQRDREISRFGDHVGQSFVVLGAIAVLVMALAELDHFWIANTIYLAFVLSAALGSAARIGAYRRGFHPW
ncbi:hypothetical protein ABZ348_10915 [Streptomyces sp. NPDC005963]|uniref:hypothetical protein n=1 Tax=Streptomyces sp. NPDC005963 TaxID=3156721 RepID=UPI0033E3347D